MFGHAKYFSLYDLESKKDLDELLAIISLFNLDNICLKSLITVEQDSEFLKLGNNKNFKLEIVKTGKRPLSKKEYQEIELEFIGAEIESLIRLAAKEGQALYITSVDDDMIELILNDNDHNYITYSTKTYKNEEIKAKIKSIKQKKLYGSLSNVGV